MADDNGTLDIKDLCKVYLCIDVYIQYLLSLPEFYGSPLGEEELNPGDIVNLEEEYLLSKLNEEVVIV